LGPKWHNSAFSLHDQHEVENDPSNHQTREPTIDIQFAAPRGVSSHLPPFKGLPLCEEETPKSGIVNICLPGWLIKHLLSSSPFSFLTHTRCSAATDHRFVVHRDSSGRRLVHDDDRNRASDAESISQNNFFDSLPSSPNQSRQA